MKCQLKQIRKAKHLTQTELADRCNVHTSQISRVERMSIQPSLSLVLKIARAVDRGVGEIWQLEDDDYVRQQELDLPVLIV